MTSSPAGPATARRLIIVHPMDPRGLKVGGVETHVRQVLRHAPAGTVPLMVGVDDRGDLPRGVVSTVEFAGRSIEFFPVAHVPAAEQAETARSILRSNTLRFVAGFMRFLPRLRRMVRERPATVEVERYELSVLAELLGLPTVLVVHNGVEDIAQQDSLTRHVRGVMRRLECRAYRSASKIFVVTQRLRDKVVGMVPQVDGRTEVLAVSIDTSTYRPTPFDLDDGNLHVAYAGRLETVKDPELMFAVAAALDRKLDGRFRFHYAGSSDPERWPHFSEVRDHVVRHGALTAEGMAAMLRAAHIGLMTSRFEGMPCFLLESLASGRPFAGIHLPQFEQVVLDERHGRMFERADSVAETADIWSDGIIGLWNDIRAGRIDPDRLHGSVQPFSVERQLGRLFAAHTQLLGDDAPAAGSDITDPVQVRRTRRAA